MNLVKRRHAVHEREDPFDWMGEWRHEMNRLFDRSLMRKDGWGEAFVPEIDLVEEKDIYLVKADIPGLKKEELDIKVEGKILSIKGERKQEKETKEKNFYAAERFYGAFSRTIELPTDVKAEEVKASYKDGVLEITLPKSEGAKAKQISVEVK